MISREETVELIQTETERFKRYLLGLPPEALDCLTPCPRWTVGDLIAHLVWFVDVYGGNMARALRGDLSPPEGFPESGSMSETDREELYAIGAINLRQQVGTGLLPAFSERYNWLTKMLKSIGPEDWEKPCYHASITRPIYSFLPTIIQELVIHQWDIQFSLGAASRLSAESLPVLMEKLPLGRPATNRRPWTIPFPRRPDSASSIRYRFDLAGSGANRLDIVIEGNKPRMEASTKDLADLCVYGNTSSFILLIYDRVSLDSGLSKGDFTAEGDRELVWDFDCWLATH